MSRPLSLTKAVQIVRSLSLTRYRAAAVHRYRENVSQWEAPACNLLATYTCCTYGTAREANNVLGSCLRLKPS